MGKITSFRISSFCPRRSLLSKCYMHELYFKERKLEIHYIYDNLVWIILLGILLNNWNSIIFIFRFQYWRSI